MRDALIAALLGMLVAIPAGATTVFVTSVGYQDVQLIINGQNVRSLRVGEVSPEGVKLTGIESGAANLEVDGRPMSLRLGQSTYSQAVLKADPRGHFVTTARINGVGIRAMIDTGATLVSMNLADAQSAGIIYAQGQRGVSQTPNGPTTVYFVNVGQVQVGDIAFFNVPGQVRVDGAAQQTGTLIGMSFLRQVEMRRSGDTMTLFRADR